MALARAIDQRGSSLIEFSIASTLIISVVITALSIFYFIAALFWSRYQLQEALICFQQGQDAQLCQQNYQSSMKNTFSLVQISGLQTSTLHISPSTSTVQGKVTVSLNQPLTITQELQLFPFDKP